jgi:hypothetical protein
LDGREGRSTAAGIAAAAIYELDSQADEAVEELQRSGFDMESIFTYHSLLRRRLLVAACCSLVLANRDRTKRGRRLAESNRGGGTSISFGEDGRDQLPGNVLNGNFGISLC